MKPLVLLTLALATASAFASTTPEPHHLQPNAPRYLKLGNDVARFDFDYLDLPMPTLGFVPRKSADGEMSFDPDTLKPRRPKVLVVVKTEPETGCGAPLAHEIMGQQTSQIEPSTPEPSSVVIAVDIPEQVMDDSTERGVEEERQAELAFHTDSEPSLAIDHTVSC